MRSRKLKNFQNDLLLLLGQFFLFVLSIVFIGYFYSAYIAPDKRVAEDFTISSCKVIAKGMVESGGIYHRYRAEFRLAYDTPNGLIQSVTSANGIDRKYGTDLASQQAYLDEFEIGSLYPCWFNPARMTEVVLVLRHSWYSAIPLLLPALIAVIMLFYMVKTSVNLVELYFSLKTKKSR